MKLDKLTIANALALASAILWLLCTVIVAILPDFAMTVANWWMHGLDMSTMGQWNITFSSFFLGGITLVVSSWATGYIFAWSWEKMSKKR